MSVVKICLILCAVAGTAMFTALCVCACTALIKEAVDIIEDK